MLNIFKDKKLIYVAALVSLFLQIISFVTTYQGASYYFKEIFALSPLLFATAVQSVVYFLENSVRHRAGFTKITALVLAIACSTYFSYIGIYNTVNSPLDYYRQAYNSYKEELEASYTDLKNKTSDTADSLLKKTASTLTGSYTSLKMQKKELEAILKELDSVSAEFSGSMAAPSESNFNDYESYAAAYEKYIQQASSGNSSEINKKTRTVLKKYGYKNRLEVVTRLSDINGRLKALKQSCRSLAADCGLTPSDDAAANIEKINSRLSKKVSSGGNTQASLYSNISKFTELANQYKTSGKKLDATRITSCIELNSSARENLLGSFDDISGTNPSECKNILLQELSAGIAELNRVCKLTGKSASFEESSYPLDDIYVIPVKRLAQPETSAIAFSCLLIAMLTDFLSLLFAMMFCPPFKVLKLHQYNKVLNDESMFEENIASALSLSMHVQDGRTMPESKTLNDEQLKRLAGFIGFFETVPNKLSRKYILYTKLENLKEYQALVAILCQLGLAKIMPGWRYKKYASAYNGNVPVEAPGMADNNEDGSTENITDTSHADGLDKINNNENIVLLKINFLLWCNGHWTVPETENINQII